ncbi:hypothetical protein KEG38_31645 [Polyangium jinanense]|uniref:hypothetical protein n=1 Tax=Polyangium jinanense TaxID=2829994 RepID=UPI0023427FAA|nr:hypothetical protein [Polyangium jinanense]MDC3958453.1 hypothetical protein [Polyangium jinanense]
MGASLSLIVGFAVTVLVTGAAFLLLARDKMRADHQWYIEAHGASPGLFTLFMVVLFGRSAPAAAEPRDEVAVAAIAAPEESREEPASEDDAPASSEDYQDRRNPLEIGGDSISMGALFLIKAAAQHEAQEVMAEVYKDEPYDVRERHAIALSTAGRISLRAAFLLRIFGERCEKVAGAFQAKGASPSHEQDAWWPDVDALVELSEREHRKATAPREQAPLRVVELPDEPENDGGA